MIKEIFQFKKIKNNHKKLSLENTERAINNFESNLNNLFATFIFEFKLFNLTFIIFFNCYTYIKNFYLKFFFKNLIIFWHFLSHFQFYLNLLDKLANFINSRNKDCFITAHLDVVVRVLSINAMDFVIHFCLCFIIVVFEHCYIAKT